MTTEPLDVRDLLAAGGAQPWQGAPPGTTMGHVHLHVGNLGAAEAFYHVGLGFDKTVWSYPGALFFSAGGYHHHLGTNTWAPGPSAADDEARLLESGRLLFPTTTIRPTRPGVSAAQDSRQRTPAAVSSRRIRGAPACVSSLAQPRSEPESRAELPAGLTSCHHRLPKIGARPLISTQGDRDVQLRTRGGEQECLRRRRRTRASCVSARN